MVHLQRVSVPVETNLGIIFQKPYVWYIIVFNEGVLKNLQISICADLSLVTCDNTSSGLK